MKDITQLDPVALRTLVVATRLGTFEATARELHVTPSAVSQRIKALETRIGRVLLHRVKPLEPTEAGLVLVRLATQTELLEREAVAELVEGADEVATSYSSLPIAVNADTLYGVVRRRTRRGADAPPRRLRGRPRGPHAYGGAPASRGGDGRHHRRAETCSRVPRGAAGPVALHRGRDARVPRRPLRRPASGRRTLAEAPLVAFDRSDSLQHDFARRVTRRHLAPPTTYLPSVREFDRAIRVGMGWGLLPESDVAGRAGTRRPGRARAGQARRRTPLLAALDPRIGRRGRPDHRRGGCGARVARLRRQRLIGQILRFKDSTGGQALP